MPSQFKVKITGYHSDPTASGGGGSGFDSFEAVINPTTIKRSKSVQFNSNKKNNLTTKDVKQYDGQGEETLSFSLVLDGTVDTSDPTSGLKRTKSVLEQLDQLNKVAYKYYGADHKTPFCSVQFTGRTVGDEKNLFYCHLKTFDIEYTMFSYDGEPLRAKVDLAFTFHIDPAKLSREMNLSSPDMSHLITIKDGDKLSLICQDIYRDFNYYTDIAETNKLTNFRNIKAGTRLLFPPLRNS